MENDIYEVAIVGAGPAGSAAAISCLSHGCKSVALIDKATFPRDKSCGDGLGPGVLDICRELGIEDVFAGYTPIKFLSVSSPAKHKVSGPLPNVGNAPPEGYVIPRKVFDSRVYEKAIGRGAANVTGFAFESAQYDQVADLWIVQLKGQEGQRTIRSKYLIGADGARSKVRRLLGFPLNKDEHSGIGARIYSKLHGADETALRLDFTSELLPAYGWFFPSGDGSANVGVGIDASLYKIRKIHLQELTEKYRRSLCSDIDQSFAEETYLAYPLPYARGMPQLSIVGKPATLIGDAASMINPLTGEGIFYGMFAGNLIGRYLGNGLRDGIGFDVASRQYSMAFKRKFERHFVLNWEMKKKVSEAVWCDRVIKACERDQRVLADLIDLMMGDKKEIDPRMLFRIAFGRFLPFL